MVRWVELVSLVTPMISSLVPGMPASTVVALSVKLPVNDFPGEGKCLSVLRLFNGLVGGACYYY